MPEPMFSMPPYDNSRDREKIINGPKADELPPEPKTSLDNSLELKEPEIEEEKDD